MARLLATIILAAALLLPTSADAQRIPGHHHTPVPSAVLARLASRNPVVRAIAVAERYWGAVPCGGQITVLDDMRVPAGLDPSTDAWVTFNSSLGENDLQAPAITYSLCTIGLAGWQWSTPTSMQSDWNMFCLTVTHEVGHLLGHPHSPIPGSVMAPVFTDEANVPPICRATRAPGRARASRMFAG
jgi:Matrixin